MTSGRRRDQGRGPIKELIANQILRKRKRINTSRLYREASGAMKYFPWEKM
jgi:hypothetical protein